MCFTQQGFNALFKNFYLCGYRNEFLIVMKSHLHDGQSQLHPKGTYVT